MTKDIEHSFSQDKMHIVMRNTDCPNCEYHRQRAQRWREEAYKLSGHPLPVREWVGLTDEEIKAFDTWHDNREEEIGWVNPSEIVAYIEAKLKEKNS
jgi:hypothetical protein